MAVGQAVGETFRQRQSAETRRALVASAREAFAEVGYQATTVEDIAATLGATRGAFYRHFADKRAIFEVVVSQVASEIVDEVWNTSYELATNSEERERHAARLFLRQLSQKGTNRILAIDGPAVLGYARWSEIIHSIVSGPLEAGVRGWSAAGAFNEQLVEPLTRMLVGVFQAASAHLAAVDDRSDAASDYEAALTYMIAALRRPGPSHEGAL